MILILMNLNSNIKKKVQRRKHNNCHKKMIIHPMNMIMKKKKMSANRKQQHITSNYKKNKINFRLKITKKLSPIQN